MIQLQKAIYRGLRSCALFDSVNVVMEREFRTDSEIEMASLWMTPRKLNGDGSPASPVGLGLLVEMPTLDLEKPNSLQRFVVLKIGVVEERNLNMTQSQDGAPGGSLMEAEDWAEMALDFMFAWKPGVTSGLKPERGTVKPAQDLIEATGLVCYRAACSCRIEHVPLARCDEPAIVEQTPGVFIFQNGARTPDAAIYYMASEDRTNLELPCKESAPDAVLWDGNPVQLPSGQFVNWAAWRDDLLPSHVNERQIS